MMGGARSQDRASPMSQKERCTSMKIAIIQSGPVDHREFGEKLALFFSIKSSKMKDVSPVSVNDADLVLIDFANADDRDLQQLKRHWNFLELFPIVAMIDPKSRKDRTQADAFGITNIISRSGGLSEALALIRRLGAPDLLAALPAGTSPALRAAYRQSNAYLEELQLAGATLDAIPVKAGREVASNLLGTLKTEGIHAWINSVKTHHSPTFAHSLEVAGLAGWLASQIGWSEDDCIQVTTGGLLHDIGKSQIPLSVLDKPAALDDVERDLVQKHVLFGYKILGDRPEVDCETKAMVLCHHELLDGSGYPLGLAGDAISPKVRLTTICDLFSALTEERAYKAPLSSREAFAIMNRMDSKIDQSLYEDFRSLMLPYRDDFGRVRRACS